MHTSSYFTSSLRPNPYNLPQSFESYDMYSNRYYSQKIFDDHRLERKMLERPAFLIKQEPLYPESDSFKIGSALDYADSLTRAKTQNFYTEAAEEERIRVHGSNPFYQTNPYLAVQSKNSYLKRSTKSKLDTNPNLGVTSYEVLKESSPQQLNNQFIKQRHPLDFSSIKKSKHRMENQIASFIVDQSTKKITEKQRSPFQQNPIIRQEQNSDEDMFSSQKPVKAKKQISLKRTTSTIILPKNNPQQIIYKGKKYVNIVV